MRFVLPIDELRKAPFVGPRGGLWADLKHTVHWDPKKHGFDKPTFVAADLPAKEDLESIIDRLLKLPIGQIKKLKAQVDERKREVSSRGEATPMALMRWSRAVNQALEGAEEAREKVVTVLPKTFVIKKPAPQPQQMTLTLTVPPEPPMGAPVEPEPEPAPEPKPKKDRKKRAPKPAPPVEKKRALPSGEKRIEQVGDHVWGSRKDLAVLAQKIREGERDLSQEDLATMSYDDAAYIVNKKNLVPAWDLNVLKSFGMEPGAAHLALSVVAAVRGKPEDSKEAREQYRADVRSLLGGLRDCKTSSDVGRLFREIGRSINQADGWEMLEDIEVGPNWDREAAIKRAHQLTEQTGIKHQVMRSYRKGTFLAKQVPKPYEQFGSRFASMTSQPYRSKVWRTATREADKADQAEDGWAWLEGRGGASTTKSVADKRKEALKAAGFSGEAKRGWSEAKLWQALEGQPVERKGHSVEVMDADQNRVRNTFNLKEVDYGQDGYMNQADREYHTKQFEGAMHDFAEVLGIEPSVLSLNGRLSIAFGARGRGAAKAHYEPMGKIINITKYRGGGSLSHEWGHAMDNVMAELFVDAGSKASGTFLSESTKRVGIPDEVRSAIQGVMDAIEKHPDPVRAAQEHREHVTKLVRQRNVEVSKANVLVKAVKEIRSRPETQEMIDRRIEKNYQPSIAQWKKEADEQDAKNKARKAKGQRVSMDKDMDVVNRRHWIKQYEKKIQDLREKGPRTAKDAGRLEELDLKIEGYRIETNRMQRYISQVEKVDPTVSDFARSAQMMGEYYGMTVEKFARSFESFIQDELRSKGRKSDYLTGGRKTEALYATEIELPNGKEAQPYPHGEERKAIGKAMRQLVDVLRDTGTIEKALLHILPITA